MAIGDRILLLVYSLLVLVGSVVAVMTAAGLPDEFVPAIGAWDVIGVGSILFLISLRFLFYRERRKRRDKQPPSISTRNENGEVRISLDTLESLILRAGRSVRGVSDMRTRIRIEETGIRVALRLTVEPDVHIPTVCTDIQSKVKSYVSTLSGVSVEEVIVTVQDLRKQQLGGGKSGKDRSRDLA